MERIKESARDYSLKRVISYNVVVILLLLNWAFDLFNVHIHF